MIAAATYKPDVDRYIAGVLDGSIVAGRQVILAVRRHVTDLKHAGERGYVFDEFAANQAIEFFPSVCRHSIGEWASQPFDLSDFEMFIVWCLIGWRKKADGLRRFRKALISLARKNGKSTFLAGLALLLTLFDNPVEPAAEVVIAATKEQQAGIIFREAKRMVAKSPALAKRCKVFTKAITVPHNGSNLYPIGSDSDTTDGLNPHAVLKDELHAWRERHRGLYEKLATGGAARRQPLDITITTAGDDKSDLWQEESTYALRVVESSDVGEIVDDSYFAFVACLDPEDDPFDEKVWAKANPNLGISVRLEYLREQANEAQNKPTAKNSFLRYHCNLKVASSEKIIRLDKWMALPRTTMTNANEGFGAFDLGRSNDFAAWCVVCPLWCGDHYEYEVFSRSFTCDNRNESIDTAQVRRWVEMDLLESHPEDSVDFTVFEQKVVEANALYGVRSWAHDPTFAKQMAQTLVNNYGFSLFNFTQVHRHYNEPIRELQRLIQLGWIRHNGCPVLAWQMSNLQVAKNTKDEWMPDKGGSQFKIDAAVALLMALSEAMYGLKNRSSEYVSMWD